MEENVDLFSEIRACFGTGEVDLRTYSPLTLAFVGDSAYDLVIRSLLVGKGNEKTSRLHAHASHLVRAEAQSEMMEVMLPELTDEEQDYYRRGCNAKPATMAKNASAGEYHRATGFETLMGYLYLTGKTERMLELIRTGLRGIDAPEAEE